VSQSGELTFFADQQGQTPSIAQSSQGRPQLATDAALRPDRVKAAFGRLDATSAALDPSQLPPSGQDFVKRFTDEYGRAPGRYAAYGYEAMALILDAVDRASDPTDRSAVVDALFDTADRDSVLGTYSIAENGETTLDRMTGYEIANGEAKPVEELSPQ
jgi:ABC-type branched-subunit amino acid transport system substrate-binding protein